jgi:hypothetical protein
MTDVDVLPSDTSWPFEPTTGVHQFGGGSLVLVGCAILDANRDTFCHWALGAACATACEVIALSGTRRLS